MEKFRPFPLILCLVAATNIVSCDTDTDTGLSDDEVQQCYQAVKGTYTGNLVYAATNEDDATDTTDTLRISWQIATDSTLTIYNFPTSLMAQGIDDEELKDALEDVGTTNISCSTYYYNVSPVYFLINPTSPSFTLTYGGSTHTIHIAFYVNTPGSVGMYTSSSEVMQMQILQGGIYVDSTLMYEDIYAFYFISDTKI